MADLRPKKSTIVRLFRNYFPDSERVAPRPLRPIFFRQSTMMVSSCFLRMSGMRVVVVFAIGASLLPS